MKLKKIVLVVKHADSGYVDISFDSRWACDWYVELLTRYAKQCRARFIEIVLTDEPENQPATLVNGTLSIEWAFDLAGYNRSSFGGKKRSIATTIHDCLVNNTLLLAISEAVITKCSCLIEEDAYTRSWCSRKVASVDKRQSAQLEYVHDLHTFSVHLRIDDRKGRTLQRIPVGAELPDSIVFDKLIGDICWFADGSIEVVGAHGVYFSTRS